MILTPSPHFPDEFVVSTSDGRGASLVAALGCKTYQRLTHMTPARAKKASALYDLGFTAIGTDDGWRFIRSGSRQLTLDHAMMVVEVMA